jgi:hypothetical protein
MSLEGFYFTEGFKVSDYVRNEPVYNIEYDELFEAEVIMGYIHRWVLTQPKDFIRTGFGLFGGLGARISEYRNLCYSNSQDCDEIYINMRHELGAELILGYISLYIAERNFHQIGGGIGLVFWRMQ